MMATVIKNSKRGWCGGEWLAWCMARESLSEKMMLELSPDYLRTLHVLIWGS